MDETSGDADTVLQTIAHEGAVVPGLWRLEIANSLRNAVRRKRCDEGFVIAAIARLEDLPIVEDPHTSASAWFDTSDLARDEGLTVYDASYLELALRRNLPLATGDKALIAAGKRRGVEVFTP